LINKFSARVENMGEKKEISRNFEGMTKKGHNTFRCAVVGLLL